MRSKSMIKVKPFRIHAEFENNTELKCALNLIAEKLKLELYWSEGWDLVAMHFDIAIIDRKVINREAWEYYLNENMVN